MTYAFDYRSGRELCERLLQKEETLRPTAAEALQQGRNWLNLGRDESPEARKSIVHQSSMELERQRLETVASGMRRRERLENMATEMHRRSHLDQCVMACVASQMNATSLRHINSAFERADTDGLGRLSKEHMLNALAELGVQGGDAELVITMVDPPTRYALRMNGHAACHFRSTLSLVYIWPLHGAMN